MSTELGTDSAFCVKTELFFFTPVGIGIQKETIWYTKRVRMGQKKRGLTGLEDPPSCPDYTRWKVFPSNVEARPRALKCTFGMRM